MKGSIPEYKTICIVKCLTIKIVLMRLWTHPCLIFLSNGEWKCLVDSMISCCMVNWEFIFSPLLNWCIPIWKLSCERSEPDLILSRLATNPMIVFEVFIAHPTLVILLSRTSFQRKIWHNCIYSREVQLLGNSSKDFHPFCQAKTVHQKNYSQQCCSSSNCHCKEHKLCIYWFSHWKSILVSAI